MPIPRSRGHPGLPGMRCRRSRSPSFHQPIACALRRCCPASSCSRPFAGLAWTPGRTCCRHRQHGPQGAAAVLYPVAAPDRSDDPAGRASPRRTRIDLISAHPAIRADSSVQGIPAIGAVVSLSLPSKSQAGRIESPPAGKHPFVPSAPCRASGPGAYHAP